MTLALLAFVAFAAAAVVAGIVRAWPVCLIAAGLALTTLGSLLPHLG